MNFEFRISKPLKYVMKKSIKRLINLFMTFKLLTKYFFWLGFTSLLRGGAEPGS